MQSTRPLVWVAAALFLLVDESLVILGEYYHHVYRTSSIHFWIAPIMCIGPLLVGYNFEGAIRKDSESRDHMETGLEASAMIGILVLAAYTTIACAVARFI